MKLKLVCGGGILILALLACLALVAGSLYVFFFLPGHTLPFRILFALGLALVGILAYRNLTRRWRAPAKTWRDDYYSAILRQAELSEERDRRGRPATKEKPYRIFPT